MDTTYVNIMLVVFLVLAALAIDVGYMYVSDEDLQHAAQLSAIAGAQGIKQGIHSRIQSNPAELGSVVNDSVQASARVAAIETAIGDHKAVALIEVPNNNINNMTTENFITVGFWDMAANSYTPGATPVNAIQVRTKRTAESESVGLGEMGSIIAKITGMETENYTPVAIAAIPPKARANFALSSASCDSSCTYPKICTIPEKRLSTDGSGAAKFAFTTMAYLVAERATLSDMICREMPAQDLCGKTSYVTFGTDQAALRDIESMMYNPKVDSTNKEYDKKTGKFLGWWVIAPVVDSLPSSPGSAFEPSPVKRYALVRISRVCATGPAGCGSGFDAPSGTCGQENGLYIDRISCAGCGTREMSIMPGLHPVIVK